MSDSFFRLRHDLFDIKPLQITISLVAIMAEESMIIHTAICNDFNDCSHTDRIMTTLSYYNTVSSQKSAEFIAFIDFCNTDYSKQYLEDYIHFITVHKNDINKVEKETQTCSIVGGCSSTKRHYRDRSINDDSKQNDIVSQHMCVDIFDTLHFFIYHMDECGLRVSRHDDNDTDNNENGTDNDNDYTNYIDRIIETIQKEIEISKRKCGFFKRLDNTKNCKFNIMQVMDKKPHHEINPTGETFTDDMFQNIGVCGIEKDAVYGLTKYLSVEEYDTDSIQNDVDIYEEEKQCNLLEAARYNLNCIEEIKNHIKMVTISSTSFSTGFVFWYWAYYKYVDDNTIKQQQYGYGTDNNFGGYDIQNLFVTEQFSSLKLEVLNTKFITIEQFEKKVIQKGDAYFITTKCKQMKCIIDNDGLHFGIKKGDSLKKEHLYSLILYCDFTDFC
eukprot:8959_1